MTYGVNPQVAAKPPSSKLSPKDCSTRPFFPALAHEAQPSCVGANNIGTCGKDQTPVLGCLERGGKVFASVIPNRKRKTLHNLVRAQFEGGSADYMDALASYDGVAVPYDH
jgi:hypothetical protein